MKIGKLPLFILSVTFFTLLSTNLYSEKNSNKDVLLDGTLDKNSAQIENRPNILRCAVYIKNKFLFPDEPLPWKDSITVKSPHFQRIVNLDDIAYIIPAAYFIRLMDNSSIHYVDVEIFQQIPGWESRDQIVFYIKPGMELKAKEEYDRICRESGPENPYYFELISDPGMKKALEQYKRDELMKLETLNLIGNQITKIEGLDKLINVTSLYLSDNKITKIQGLENLTRLNLLFLNNNLITEIQGLDKLTNLYILLLSNNKIEHIKGIDKLTRLTHLEIGHNNLLEIQGLDSLVKLNTLVLSYNKISRIMGLENLSNLYALYLIDNKITKIEGIDKLLKLKDFFISNNPAISDIGSVKNLKNLEFIGLQGTSISLNSIADWQFEKKLNIEDFTLNNILMIIHPLDKSLYYIEKGEFKKR